MTSLRPTIFAVFTFAFGASSCPAETWVLADEAKTEYFGEAVSYDLESKQLTIRKVDGKEHSFSATDLNFSSKWNLMWDEAFGKALQGYRPPILALLTLILAALLALGVPTFIGLWGGAHVFGVVAGFGKHFQAFVKILAVVVVLSFVVFLGLVLLDSELPLVPDKNADVLLMMVAKVMGLLVTGLVLSIHYQRSFRKGLGIALVSDVFAGIVGVALLLAGLFVALRIDDLDGLITNLFFEPFGLF